MNSFFTCTLEKDGEAILAILNHAILTSTALYDYEPRAPESMQAWFALRQERDFPVIGIKAQDGNLAGFATYAPFRPHAAYRFTVEHSVYVNPNYKGLGYGKSLLQELITNARRQKLRTMIGVIDAENEVSIQLHRKLGFEQCGRLEAVGYKFERWLDVDLYQLDLSPEKQGS